MTNAPESEDKANMVTGLFKDRKSVERAYQSVARRGYDTGDINVLMSDSTRKLQFAGERASDMQLGSKAAEGGELGGPVGGTIGTLLPVIIAAGVLALPGLGLIAVGPVAIALAGAGAAGAAFGLLAALSDWGIPEQRAKQYDAGIRDGGILMGIKPRSEDDARYFEEQWKVSGGQGVHA
jgi:hypothetical protein